MGRGEEKEEKEISDLGDKLSLLHNLSIFMHSDLRMCAVELMCAVVCAVEFNSPPLLGG